MDELSVDFEIEQLIKINYWLHKIVIMIQKTFDMKNEPKKIYHIVLNWFMFQLGTRSHNKLNMLDGITFFDYKQLIIDIYNYKINALSENKDTAYDNIKKKFYGIELEIKTECHRVNDFLKKYVPNNVNRVDILNNSDGEYFLKYITPKKYVFGKFQNINSPTNIKLNKNLYDKLIKRLNENDIMDIKKCHKLIFILLTRYKLYEFDKVGVSLAVDKIYKIDNLKNALEMFASPVNCHLTNFCSLFPEIEKFFGSIGSAFSNCNNMEYWTKYDYLICNPPYCTQVMEKMAGMIISIFKHAIQIDKKITFIVSIPDWRDLDEKKTEYYESFNTYNILKEFMTKEYVREQYKYFDYFNYREIILNNTGTLVLVLSTGDASDVLTSLDNVLHE